MIVPHIRYAGSENSIVHTPVNFAAIGANDLRTTREVTVCGPLVDKRENKVIASKAIVFGSDFKMTHDDLLFRNCRCKMGTVSG
jgi:hypothetical protein